MSSVIAKILAQQAANRIKQVFENLKEGEFEITSPFDAKYNCLAHAAADSEKWWWAVDTKTADNDVFWFNNSPYANEEILNDFQGTALPIQPLIISHLLFFL